MLPEFLGGMSNAERLGVSEDTYAKRTSAGDGGADFFDGNSAWNQEQEARFQRETASHQGRRDVAMIPINAPITINGAADPNELARQLTVKLDGIFRTAKKQLDEED